MVAEFTVAMGTIKEALALAKGIKDGAHQSQLNSIAIDLQQKILDVQAQLAGFQQQHLELQQDYKHLKADFDARDEWEAESNRYEAVALSDNLIAYQLREEHSNNHPRHYLCPNCFAAKKKSFLLKTDANRDLLNCNLCKLECLPIKYPESSSLPFVVERDPWDRGLMC